MTQVDIRMTRARSQLIQKHAFFGALAMRLLVVERKDIPTMATDGKYLFYAVKFLNELTEAKTLFWVAHEVLHCALGHMTRRGSRDPLRWNKACDFVVNWLLHEAGFTVPDDALCFDPRFAGMGAEEVYSILLAEEQKQQQQEDDDDQDQDEGTEGQDRESYSDDQDRDNYTPSNDDENEDEESDQDGDSDDQDDEQSDGDGGGADDDENSSESSTAQGGSGGAETDQSGEPQYQPSCGDAGGGEVLDAAPEHDKAAQSEVAGEWEVYTRQAANIARRQGEGRLPGFIEEIIQTLEEPRVDWREELRRFVDPMTSTKDYSWVQPNRRMLGLGYVVPGLISDGVNHIGIFIDTSISISEKWLQRFGGEAQSALDAGGIDKITVVFADTQVNRFVEYTKGDTIDFTVVGRGGTRFAPTFEWAMENTPDLTAAIYFTDLECTDFGEQPSFPVLWAVHGTRPDIMQMWIDRAPWGECIKLVD